MAYKLFVTGTDTDVGKTMVTAALVRGAQLSGHTLAYWKPVQTGHPDSDSQTVSQLSPETLIHPCQYIYQLPASPDQAALAENRDAPKVQNLMQDLKRLAESTILEGAGGLNVPLNQENETWCDFLKESKLSCIVVARTGLGTLNHTSMTLDLMKLNDIAVRAVILCGPRHQMNMDTLERMYPNTLFLHFDQQRVFPSANFDKCARKLWQDVAAAGDQPRIDTLALDQEFCWHPYTQHKTAHEPLNIVQAKGIWLKTQDGEELVDGTSSWWANTIGHGHKSIGTAIHRQQQTVDHVIFAGATHEGAARLSSRLSRLSDYKFSKVFYTDNGSCAVEVAIKMALQSTHNRGQHKSKIVSLKGSYHGDTFGAMSLGGSDSFHSPFSQLLFETIKLSPVTEHPSHLCPEGPVAFSGEKERLHKLFTEQSNEIAAVLLEPLVQGASGMLLHHLPWLQYVCQLANDYGIPLIFDEVFTGLGRCGDTFAYKRFDLDPDIICIAKGLTGGTLPLAATMVKEDIFESFLSDDKAKAFYHGHTYTANAICCAAANATLDLYEDLDLIKRSWELEKSFQAWLDANKARFALENPRAIGCILAWELPGSGHSHYFSPLASQIPTEARKHGLFLRPLGNTMYFLPPLTISDEELDFCLNRIEKTLVGLNYG